VEIVGGVLDRGYPQGGPYDAILLNGSVQEIPEAFFGQLREGGRVVAVVTSGVAKTSPGKAYLFVEVDGEASGLPHFDAGARPLPGFSPARAFAF